jgi:hypothetical protein
VLLEDIKLNIYIVMPLLLMPPLPPKGRGSQPQLLATRLGGLTLSSHLVSILQELIVPLLRPDASLLLCAPGLHKRPVRSIQGQTATHFAEAEIVATS